MFRQGLHVDRDLARYRFAAYKATGKLVPIPVHLDRRFEMLPSNNQGETPRCAAYAMAGCAEYWLWKNRGIGQQIDPDPIYTRAKQIDGMPEEEGTTLEAAARAAMDLSLLPIRANSFRVVHKEEVKQAIHQYGVLLSGFVIHESWGRARPDGWLNLEGNVLGGHAVVCVGYADDENPPWVAVQNSWGDLRHGWKGFVRMSPEQFSAEFLYGLVWEVE